MLIYADHVSDAFARRVDRIADRLGTDPNFLMAVMHFETAGSFSPSVRNPYSGATGLIQFMPRTARDLGTSTEALARMTPEGQLSYVWTYLKPYAWRLSTLEDTYMAVLWPAGIGTPNDAVLWSGPDGAVYRQNRGLDINSDGRVTKAEASHHVRQRYEQGLDAR